MWKHCTQAQESADALEHVKCNHFTETYVLEIDEEDLIDLYESRLRPMPAAEALIDAQSGAEDPP